jgi:hypothetical protein
MALTFRAAMKGVALCTGTPCQGCRLVGLRIILTLFLNQFSFPTAGYAGF